jgi:tetratricopeptide (TPR) repeat protein
MNTRIIVSVLFPVWLLFPPLNNFSDNWTLSEKTQLSIDDIEKQFNQCIQKGDLLTPIGSSAYDNYQLFLKVQPENHTTQRELKRTLVAKLVEIADQNLTLYFKQGGSFLSTAKSNKDKSMDRYYTMAAKLMGEDYYLYDNLMSKALFAEALRHQYLEETDAALVKAKLKKSLELDPFASYTYNELGQVYFIETNYSAACEQYRQAIKWNANWKLAHQNLQTAEAALLQSQKK